MKFKFQSPRSGKFVSNAKSSSADVFPAFAFQSPRSGKFVSDVIVDINILLKRLKVSIP